MKEDFLHFVWKNLDPSCKVFITEGGEEMEIVHRGDYNTDAGPDFSMAKIRIGKLLWIGNVEIHIHSSDWYRHHHEQDDSYANVILHVVWKHDRNVITKGGKILPTLSLESIINKSQLKNYLRILRNRSVFPCLQKKNPLPEIYYINAFEKAWVQRIERKLVPIRKDLLETKGDWNEVAFRAMARNFGFRTNSIPFDYWSRITPLKLIEKNKDDILNLEALFFGQAGFLSIPSRDPYHAVLKEKYEKLSSTFGLQCMNVSSWKFARMRPVNFPTVRMAQLAVLLHQRKSIFADFFQRRAFTELIEELMVVPSDFWLHHYMFGKPSRVRFKRLGREAAENIIINTLVPLQVAYGIEKGMPEFITYAEDLLKAIPAERNFIVGKWTREGFKCNNAFDSQAMIEMWNSLCAEKKCLNCSVGSKIIHEKSIS